MFYATSMKTHVTMRGTPNCDGPTELKGCLWVASIERF